MFASNCYTGGADKRTEYIRVSNQSLFPGDLPLPPPKIVT